MVNGYNEDKHDTTLAKPIEVIKDEAVPIEKTRKIKKLPLMKKGTKVRVKLTEQKGIDRNRATDREYWSKDRYTIESANYSEDNVRYYRVKDSEKILPHLFYEEELLQVKD